MRPGVFSFFDFACRPCRTNWFIVGILLPLVRIMAPGLEPRAGYFTTHHTHQVFQGGTNEGRSKNLTRQYMAVLRWRQNGAE